MPGVDEIIRQLERLRDKAPGYGMSFMRRGPGNAGHAELNLYGPQAEAAMWLMENADHALAALRQPPVVEGIEALRELSESATDGYWAVGDCEFEIESDEGVPLVCGQSKLPPKRERDNAAFVVACVNFVRAALSEPGK